MHCLALAALVTTALADEPRGLIYYRPVERAATKTLEFDVAVYGGTPGGFATALQSARLGKNVVLVSFDPYVGGLTSAGLTATDVGRKYAIGGMAMEFYDRVGKLVDFSPTMAEKIFQDHVNYQQGYMYFMANDPQVPNDLQERVNKFGLDPNEFPNTGHWPHSIYVREGRRMLSDYVMTQADCERKRVAEDSIGLASYPMDSHPCQRVVVERDGVTTVRNEGTFDHGGGAYPVSYRSIIPKKFECTNLLVTVCLSSSHVAFGSIRMEPVYMILGQSAATAATIAIAIDDQIAIQDVDYPKLSAKLLELGQILTAPN